MITPYPPDHDSTGTWSNAKDQRDWWKTISLQLIKHAFHLQNCDSWDFPYQGGAITSTRICTCGLDALRAAIEGAAKC